MNAEMITPVLVIAILAAIGWRLGNWLINFANKLFDRFILRSKL